MTMTARAERRQKRPPEAGTRELLDHFAQGDPEEIIRLDDVLAGLEERAFGMLLFLSIPTAFIPGIAGVVSGPLVILVGVQLLFGRNEPWLPDSSVGVVRIATRWRRSEQAAPVAC
jgi:hypothetical protein